MSSWLPVFAGLLLETPVIFINTNSSTTEFHKKSIFVGKCTVLTLAHVLVDGERWLRCVRIQAKCSFFSLAEPLHHDEDFLILKNAHHTQYETPRPAYFSSSGTYPDADTNLCRNHHCANCFYPL